MSIVTMIGTPSVDRKDLGSMTKAVFVQRSRVEDSCLQWGILTTLYGQINCNFALILESALLVI